MVILNDNATFTCSVSSDRDFQNIQWFRNGTLLDNNEKGVNIRSSYSIGVLDLNNVSVDHNMSSIQCLIVFNSTVNASSVEVPLYIQGLLISYCAS